MKNSFGAAGDDFASPPKTGMAIHELGRGRVVRAAAGGKDRHSKVCTARGTRDRRVRLSPKTAILFYDVQDRLGYDRPSKAIDWLINEAKSAIHALHHPKSQSLPLDTKTDFSALDTITEAGEAYRHHFLSDPPELFDEAQSQSQSQSQREPLQSTYSGINTVGVNSPQFHAANFTYSLPTFSVEDEIMDYVPLLN